MARFVLSVLTAVLWATVLALLVVIIDLTCYNYVPGRGTGIVALALFVTLVFALSATQDLLKDACPPKKKEDDEWHPHL